LSTRIGTQDLPVSAHGFKDTGPRGGCDPGEL
jgi:hypothetical protein